MCHLTWLYSRKYGTVWYDPASSKLWNLITLSFVNFQGKLTGTSWNLLACEASLFGLLCAGRRVQILRQHFQKLFGDNEVDPEHIAEVKRIMGSSLKHRYMLASLKFT
jgi:hypothetical protein